MDLINNQEVRHVFTRATVESCGTLHQINFREAKFICELEYLPFKTKSAWYEEYNTSGSLHEVKKRYSKYTADQKLAAIKHYFKQGQCISRTVEDLGYPICFD